MLQRLSGYISKRQLFSSEDQLLVALSGGVDSICLAHMLHSLGFSIHLAHCNFGLRGEASDQDEEFCRAFAKKLAVPFHSTRFDTLDYADQHKVSIQMAARDLRYDWFRVLMNEQSLSKLVTAHHANDQTETVLLNLTKGTGVAGLRGMPTANNEIVRPLLWVEKEELLAYAKENKLTWREDQSNSENKYQRNRMRNVVIPELKKINPGLASTFSNNLERFSSLEALLKSQAAEIKRKHWREQKDEIELTMDWFDPETGGLAILEELLKPYSFTLDQITKIGESLEYGSGNVFQTEGHKLTVDRNRLFIAAASHTILGSTSIMEDCHAATLGDWQFSFDTTEQKEITTDKSKASLDFDRLEFPLTARPWQEGDRFVPLGMKGQKKVSDFMIDEKIPVNLKERVIVFESGQEIVWIAGHRISDRYKITPKTKRVFMITMTENA